LQVNPNKLDKADAIFLCGFSATKVSALRLINVGGTLITHIFTSHSNVGEHRDEQGNKNTW